MTGAPGAFARSALLLHSYGLTPVPCAADDDGKVPGVRWARWRSRPSADTITALVQRFPTSNVGVLTGLSRLSIVDVDEAALVSDMMRRFGNTPLITETPSGGAHLWYRSAGERCANLRRAESLPVDIKGKGGFVVVPPSVRPAGPHAGRAYVLKAGTWGDISRLPMLRPGSLPVAQAAAVVPGARQDSIPIGRRNHSLFHQLLRHAHAVDDFDALMDVATWLNEACDPALPDDEVVKTTASVWRIQLEGQNFVGGPSRVYVTLPDLNALRACSRGADAALLLCLLRSFHWDHADFAASPEAMAHDQVIPRWGHSRYRNALAALVELGMLTIVYLGGHGPHDPRRFSFTSSLQA